MLQPYDIWITAESVDITVPGIGKQFAIDTQSVGAFTLTAKGCPPGASLALRETGATDGTTLHADSVGAVNAHVPAGNYTLEVK